MQKFNNIKAVFFLGIFSLYLMHQFSPHFHHEHDVISAVIEHSDDHSNHHLDVTSEKEDGLLDGLVNLFLEMHIHGIFSDENLVIRQIAINQNVVEKTFSEIPSLCNVNDLCKLEEIEKAFIYHPPDNHFDLHTTNLESRGPPSLS